MPSVADPSPLAPLQEIMLRDSLALPTGGYHVEQVEIMLRRPIPVRRLAAAWADTVAAVEALRIGFGFSNGIYPFCRAASNFPGIEILNTVPENMDDWLDSDRRRAILFPDLVPWRMVCWPTRKRLVWTFHHALLDGRSIARVLGTFLTRIGGRAALPLALSRWQVPSPGSIALAEEIFREIPASLSAVEIPDDSTPLGQATRSLGSVFLTQIDELAKIRETTTATLVTWAWGQAITGFLGTDAVLVEQVRAGAPQPGTAGFTMNVLPLVIRRSSFERFPAFQDQLRMQRHIESVSPCDFEAGVFPNVDAAGVSTIMVEHSTLAHAVGHGKIVESITLHERRADALMATAHLAPDFQLEVEGPHRHELLEMWISNLERI